MHVSVHHTFHHNAELCVGELDLLIVVRIHLRRFLYFSNGSNLVHKRSKHMRSNLKHNKHVQRHAEPLLQVYDKTSHADTHHLASPSYDECWCDMLLLQCLSQMHSASESFMAASPRLSPAALNLSSSCSTVRRRSSGAAAVRCHARRCDVMQDGIWPYATSGSAATRHSHPGCSTTLGGNECTTESMDDDRLVRRRIAILLPGVARCARCKSTDFQ